MSKDKNDQEELLRKHDPDRGDLANTEPRAQVPASERQSKEDIHRQRQMPHLGDRTPEMRSGYDDPADGIQADDVPDQVLGAPDTSAPGELPEQNEDSRVSQKEHPGKV